VGHRIVIERMSNRFIPTATCRRALPAALLVTAGLALILARPADAQDKPTFIPYPVAVLQGLDKITARISTFEAPVEQPVSFGSLEIMVRTCQKRPPEEPPESAAFLEITEQKPGEEASRAFTGWMFASSPALNGLQHPVYDVWLLDCKTPE
jgi:hypothetical protein